MILARVAELHTQRREGRAAIIVREIRRSTDDALGEVDFSAAIYQFYADRAEEFLADEPVEFLEGRGHRGHPPLAVLRAHGVMPWSFPN